MQAFGMTHDGLGLPLFGQASFWFPEGRSTVSGYVDGVFYVILGISVFFFAVVVGLMLLFVLKYRRRPDRPPQPSPSHNSVLELTWSVIPSMAVAVLFVLGFYGYLDMRQPPANSYEVRVMAKKWVWSFGYPNGHIDNDLHVPAGRPIRLVMSSDDVIHSLYVPDFRIKADVVPGRYTTTWFQALRPGESNLFCAEYCGKQHSDMRAKVVVHPTAVDPEYPDLLPFDLWLEDAANFLKRMKPAAAGKLLYQRRGCAQCHSTDGSASTGPSFRGSFGTRQALADGSTVQVDENYLRESILEPQAKVRAGFKPVMPTYQGQLKNEEIDALIAFIKSLNEEQK
jgi:cytochrome c oxidase subunit II